MNEILRCDWCGEPIEMDEGDQLDVSVFESVDEDVDGNPLPQEISAKKVAEAIADAVENLGGTKDAILAEAIRAEHSYRLHDECFEQSALTEVYTDRP